MRIFISSVTHDFKIPLNGIMSTNKDLLEKFFDNKHIFKLIKLNNCAA